MHLCIFSGKCVIYVLQFIGCVWCVFVYVCVLHNRSWNLYQGGKILGSFIFTWTLSIWNGVILTMYVCVCMYVYICILVFQLIKFYFCTSECRANILASWMQFNSCLWQLAIGDSWLSQLLAKIQNWAHLFPAYQKIISQGSEHFYIAKHSKPMLKLISGYEKS